MNGRMLTRGATGGLAVVALAIVLAGCAERTPIPVTTCPAPLGDPLVAARTATEARIAAATTAAADTTAWLDANEYLYGDMPEYAALGASLTSLDTTRQEAAGAAAAGPARPALLALSCGRTGGADGAAALDAALAGLATAQSTAKTRAAEIRQQWAAERDAQLALAAGFTSRPTPVRFDVTAADPDHVDAVLLAHHAASFTGFDYVMMRWSMGGRTFPGVGGLVRFSGSVNGLYRVTALLGQFDKADESTHGPFVQAINGLAFGAYDAAFQTSWNGSEATLRVWVLMRIGD